MNFNQFQGFPGGNQSNPNPDPNQRPPNVGGDGKPGLTLNDLFAANPAFVQQYLATRGLSASNLINPRPHINSPVQNPQRLPPSQATPSVNQQQQNQYRSFPANQSPNLFNGQIIPPHSSPQNAINNQHNLHNAINNQHNLLQSQLLQQQMMQQQFQPRRPTPIPIGNSGLAHQSQVNLLSHQQQMNQQQINLQHQQHLISQQHQQMKPPQQPAHQMNLQQQHQIHLQNQLNPQMQLQFQQQLRQQQQYQQLQQLQQFQQQQRAPRSFSPSPRPSIPWNPNQELYEHIKIVRSRVVETLSNDQKALASPDFSPFKDKHDVLNRLAPYHITQFPEFIEQEEKVKDEVKVEDIEKRFLEVQKNVMKALENERETRLRPYEKLCERLLTIDETADQ